MRLLSILILLFTVTVPAHAAMYKWVDEAGRVHYSDKPVPGAIPVEREPITTYKAPPKVEKPAVVPAKVQKNVVMYQFIEITSPGRDETVMDNDGNVTVGYRLDGALAPGHRVRVMLDGIALASTTGSSVVLRNIDRGQHELVLMVVDRGDNIYVRSKPVSFFLYRHSLLFNPGK